jgi:carbon-monoxide dehydrogenase large subunit
MNEQPKFPAGTAFGSIGQPLRRKEDARLLTGKGRFSDDFSIDGQTYAAMVRSPHPHARIVRIDSAAARTMPGVLAVLTGADCKADGIKPIPHTPVPATKFDMKLTARGGGPVFPGPHMLLPFDKTRHVGEAVAMVVAKTRAQAMDAAESVAVEYQELPFVIHSEDALKPGAPVLWDEIPDNVPCDTLFGDAAKTDRAFAEAAHVVKAEFNIVRVTGVPMELRSCLAEFDAANTRSMPAPAARCGRRSSWSRCSVSRPTSCACCPTTSAAISARATGRSSSSAWCCGPREN